MQGGIVLVVGLALAALAWAVWRAYERRMPLQIGATLLSGELLGHPILRLRVRLGRGRAVDAYRVEATWVARDGAARALTVDDPAGRRIGPWTVTLRADDLGAGELRVRVAADSGGRTWSAERAWDAGAVRPGQFLSLLEGPDARLRGPGWDEADGSGGGAP
ncbi:MAG TPA: hypothetical protein PKA64_24880 [Myxococcota bacterium]|nr:hypothetical protein [Myxococcota bacterium]